MESRSPEFSEFQRNSRFKTKRQEQSRQEHQPTTPLEVPTLLANKKDLEKAEQLAFQYRAKLERWKQKRVQSIRNGVLQRQKRQTFYVWSSNAREHVRTKWHEERKQRAQRNEAGTCFCFLINVYHLGLYLLNYFCIQFDSYLLFSFSYQTRIMHDVCRA